MARVPRGQSMVAFSEMSDTLGNLPVLAVRVTNTRLFQLYHNPKETNPRTRLANLTMEQVLKELNMSAIDERCSIAQIAVFCETHKITYYALDFKYKLFETNNHLGYKSDLPRLVFVCATNHLFPVTDTEKRETIFKSCSTIGGKMNKYRTQQKFENVKLKYNEALTTMCCYLTCRFTVYSPKYKERRIVNHQ